MPIRRITIIEEIVEDVPWPQTRDLTKRQQLYEKLDTAQDAARRRAAYIAACPCNPANGGSGICGCVPPGSDVWCGDVRTTTTST